MRETVTLPPRGAGHRRYPRGAPYAPPRRRMLMGVVAIGFLVLWALAAYVMLGKGRTLSVASSPPPPQASYDVIIIPGGGLAAREPAAWVRARLDAALRHDSNTDFYLVLSRGTTHKPPPLDDGGFPIDEATASARYLVEHGVDARRVLLEAWSLDTIGNAAFARLFHADLRGWQRLLVVTSTFHLPRTRAIFDWIFTLPHAGDTIGRRRTVHIEYEAVPEAGLAEEAVLSSRRQKEDRALQALRETTIPRIADLSALHTFLFVEHGAYRARTAAEMDEAVRRKKEQHTGDGTLAASY